MISISHKMSPDPASRVRTVGSQKLTFNRGSKRHDGETAPEIIKGLGALGVQSLGRRHRPVRVRYLNLSIYLWDP